jgi:trypsin
MKSQVLSTAILFVSSQWSSASAGLLFDEKAHDETVDAGSLGGLRGSSDQKPIAQSSEQGEEDYLDPRIIGGSEATPNEYSFAVSLSDGQGHFCGGSLITKNVVLTAAHCAGGQYNAILGRHDLRRNDGQAIAKKKEIIHPQYDDWTTENDFMLVVLSSPAILNRDIQLVKLNSNDSEPRVGDDVTVMGWGDTDKSESNTRLSNVLMHVQVNVVSNSDCEASTDGRDSYDGQITQNMLCAEHRRAKDSCQGDSGGPLVEEVGGVAKQVGVVSWGIGCASDAFPGVYARVSKAYNWIERKVCRENARYATEAGFNC